MLIALIEVFAAIFVWLELIVRDAAIYVAVLFFPAALAAAIWPALAAWPGRLGRLLTLFVILKPVALIVLSFAGSAAAAGLSFSGGVPSSVGTILAATVIFALAAFAPWALMYLLAADAESAYVAAGVRAAGAAAVADGDGRSVRSAGGLRNLGAQGARAHPAAAPPAAAVALAAAVAGAARRAAVRQRMARVLLTAVVRGRRMGPCRWALRSIGAGSIGAAAGMSARSASASTPSSQSPGDGSQSQPTTASPQAAGSTDKTPPPGALVAVPDGPSGAERAARPTAAGGASTDASPQRPGSAGTPAPTEEEPPASGGPSPPGAEATPTAARPPRRRTPPRPPAPARESTRPRPALHVVEDGEEE